MFRVVIFDHLSFVSFSIYSPNCWWNMGIPPGVINESIKLISKIYIVPISPVKPSSVAPKQNQCSTAKLMKKFCNINGPSFRCLTERARALRSICWPTKTCVKNSLFICTPCLPHRFFPVRWDQTMIIVCQSLESRPRAFHSCARSLWNNLSCFLDFVVDHWLGCWATEPCFARDVGAIEVWLIDWLIVFR